MAVPEPLELVSQYTPLIQALDTDFTLYSFQYVSNFDPFRSTLAEIVKLIHRSKAHYNYPGLYGPENFHHCGLTTGDDIVNYNDRQQVQTCELVNLAE